MPKFLTEQLICPLCRARLQEKDHGTWRCLGGHGFSEFEGVPMFRAGPAGCDASPVGGDGAVSAESVLDQEGLPGRIRRLLGTNFVPYPMPPSAFIKPTDRVCNLGAGMSAHLTADTVNVDLFRFPKTDIVADAERLPFADGTFDVVVSEFMIEHVPHPREICVEMVRVLKSGGVCYVSYPLIHPYHSFPSDYFRFTHTGIRSLFPGLTPVSEGVITGPAARWLGATADMVCLPIAAPKLKLMIRAAVLALLFPVKYLDFLYNRLPDALHHSVTSYAVFRK